MLYFVRHGESQANADGVFAGGKGNPELTEKGRTQAKEAGKELLDRGVKIDRIVSSPIKRALETAQIIANEISFKLEDIQTDERITEYDVGALGGQPERDVTAAELISAEGAENPTKFMGRVIEAISEYSKEPGNILISSHAGVGRIIETHKQGLNPDAFYDIKAYPNGRIIELNRF